MPRPPPPLRRALAMAATLLLSACQPLSSTDEQQDRRAGSRPEFKRNPDPTQAYRITARIEDAPGPFEVVRGYAQYSAPRCSYMLDRIAGVPAIPEQTLPVDFAKIDAQTYVGTVFLDGMLDEDYFGNGRCEWEFTVARIELRAAPVDTSTRFVAYLRKDDLDQKLRSRAFFWTGNYPETSFAGFLDGGREAPDVYLPQLQDELFSIELAFGES